MDPASLHDATPIRSGRIGEALAVTVAMPSSAGGRGKSDESAGNSRARSTRARVSRMPLRVRGRRAAATRALALKLNSLPRRTAREGQMIIDRETFTELAVHLKLASDAILKTAHHLAAISSTGGTPSEDAEWAGTIESMMSVNNQITIMERLLRAVMDANRIDEGTAGPPGGILPC
jgi:hypothetical protein